MTSNSYHIIHVDFILYRFHITISMCHVFYKFQFISSTCMAYHIIFKQLIHIQWRIRTYQSHNKCIQGQIKLIRRLIHLVIVLFKFTFSKVSQPESPTLPDWWIQDGARFTPTFSIIISKHLLGFINFHFQKCRDPNPQLDPKGGSELEPGLLRHFPLSSQNILFGLFHYRLFNYVGTFHFGQAHKHLQLSKCIYK